MRILPVVVSFLLLLIVPVTAYGYGYPDAVGKGSTLPGVDVVSHGFGGISSVDVGGMNLFGNPAGLTGCNLELTGSIGPLILKQTVDDGLGKHALTYAGLGTSSFQVGGSSGAHSFAAGIANIRDYTYTGEYFFLDTNPSEVIAGFENLTVSGRVWEAAAGYATVVPGNVSLGVSAGYRTGDIDYEYYWHHFTESIPDSSSEWTREEGEFSWRAGASVPMAGQTSIGAVYSSESELCPASIAAGICVGNVAACSPGYGFEAKMYDTEENKAWSANFFGGIHPDHNLFFRGGVLLSSRGGSDSGTALGLSMGATVDLGRTDISAAFNYAGESREGNVFGFPAAKTINDVTTAFTIGATIKL